MLARVKQRDRPAVARFPEVFQAVDAQASVVALADILQLFMVERHLCTWAEEDVPIVALQFVAAPWADLRYAVHWQ